MHAAHRRRLPRRLTTIAAGLAALACSVGAFAAPAQAATHYPTPPSGAPTPPDPRTDPFYAQPASLDGLANGAILEVRQVSVSQYGFPQSMPGTAYQPTPSSTGSEPPSPCPRPRSPRPRRSRSGATRAAARRRCGRPSSSRPTPPSSP